MAALAAFAALLWATAPAPLLAQSGASGTAATGSQDAVRILERAASRLRGLSGFCADFRQEVRVTVLRQTTRSSGELCQSRPDRFDMRFSDPAGDRVLADGTHFWVYFPSADPGHVFRTTMAATGGRFDLHREFLEAPGERYRARVAGEEEVGGRMTDLLVLEPRTESPYRRARVWIDRVDAMVLKIEIEEESESIRTLELIGYRLNPQLPPDRFRFVPPPGVQVISR